MFLGHFEDNVSSQMQHCTKGGNLMATAVDTAQVENEVDENETTPVPASTRESRRTPLQATVSWLGGETTIGREIGTLAYTIPYVVKGWLAGAFIGLILGSFSASGASMDVIPHDFALFGSIVDLTMMGGFIGLFGLGFLGAVRDAARAMMSDD